MPQPIGQLLDAFLALERKASRTPEEEEEFTRLHELVVKRIDLVPRGANGREFAIRKTGDTMATQTDPQLGPEVNVGDDGALTAPTDTPPEGEPSAVQKIDLPGPAKAGLLKKLTAAQEKIASLVNLVKAAKENPTAKVPPEVTNAAKSIGTALSAIAAGYPSPGAKEGDEGDDVKKGEISEDVTELQALAHVEKAGAKMRSELRKKFQDHVTGLQAILKELEADPATKAMLAALTPIAKSVGASADTMAAVLKLLTEQRSTDPADPATPDPAPVPAGQAQPSAQPIAKTGGEEGWGDVCDFDLNAESDEPTTKEKQ